MSPSRTKSGLIQWIILIVIAVIILSYFGFDLKGVIEDEQTQENLKYVWGIVVDVWDNYLKRPARYIWEEILVPFVIDPIKDFARERREEKENSSEEQETAFMVGQAAIC